MAFRMRSFVIPLPLLAALALPGVALAEAFDPPASADTVEIGGSRLQPERLTLSGGHRIVFRNGSNTMLAQLKKGVLELADMIAVNKADGDNELRAKQATVLYRNALKIMKHTSPNWEPPVVMCSSVNGIGLDPLWEQIEEHRRRLTGTGELQAKRRHQRIGWLWNTLENRLLDSLRAHPKVVGIGESGLDYFYNKSPQDIQIESFRRHIRAARASGRACASPSARHAETASPRSPRRRRRPSSSCTAPPWSMTIFRASTMRPRDAGVPPYTRPSGSRSQCWPATR